MLFHYSKYLLPALAASAASTSRSNAQDATVFSLVYGTALGAFANTYQNIGSTNSYSVGRTFSSPANVNAVRPNANVLYTRGIYDTCVNDVLLTVPSVPDGRFWDISVYDPYGDNYHNLGSLFNSSAGAYVLSRAPHNDTSFYSSLTNNFQGIIEAPAMQGALFIRLYALNTTADLDIAHGIQDGFEVHTIPRGDISQPQYCITNATFGALGDDQATQVLRLTARLAGQNPPLNTSDIPRVTEMLTMAGIDTKAGTYTTPSGVNLTTAFTEELAELEAYPQNPSNFDDAGNDWLLPKGEGDFQSDYIARAFVAVAGPWAVNPSVALYPSIPHNFTLASDQAILVTFSGRPNVNAFWSLTMYLPQGAFVPNPVDHYALGNSNNLTFADGGLVYVPGAPDGEFQILIQPADVIPPANWTNNWLPSPAGGGNFTINLRWYGPTPSLIDGTYIYPIISNPVSVFTA